MSEQPEMQSLIRERWKTQAREAIPRNPEIFSTLVHRAWLHHRFTARVHFSCFREKKREKKGTTLAKNRWGESYSAKCWIYARAGVFVLLNFPGWIQRARWQFNARRVK